MLLKRYNYRRLEIFPERDCMQDLISRAGGDARVDFSTIKTQQVYLPAETAWFHRPKSGNKIIRN